MIPPTRNVRTRVFTDPEQYDTEINAARGFSKSSTTRRRPPMTQVMEDFSDLNEASQLINHVTEREVIEAQNFWAQSIVDISNSFLTGGDYVSLAGERAGELYGYDHSNVLFKPTKATEQQFRPTERCYVLLCRPRCCDRWFQRRSGVRHQCQKGFQ